MMRTTTFLLLTSLVALGCGADLGDADASGAGVAQGGAQDFGQFRQILEDGDLPHPSTLDDIGFFNEHKVELPAPACDASVCLHGELGVMGNMITGSNCTLMLLGMNTPLDPSTLERPPLNLAIAVDVSGSMSGPNIRFLREGLLRMLDDLRPEDRVSLIAFSDDAEILVEHVTGDDPDFSIAIGTVQAQGATNIYAGLREAYDVVAVHAQDGVQNRVILLSDGEATAGIVDDARIIEMSRQYNEDGLALTTIGVGDAFDPELMRELSVAGGGSFYFLEDGAAVREVFEEEVQAFLIPLATDVRLDVHVDDGYALRAVYGARDVVIDGNNATIEIPTLQLAHRSDVNDDAQGRRGGGGAIIAEVVPTRDGVNDGTVGTLELRYEIPSSGESVLQEVPIRSALEPGETPDEGAFDSDGVEKAFVMLNIYAGFDMAATRAAYGDLSGALGVLEPLRTSVVAWLEDNDDADIEDDLFYIERFIDNLLSRGAATPPPQRRPPEVWPLD